MNVLSLFDGISCGRIALERAGVKVDRYVAYEIDKWPKQISQNNWSDIEYYGDVFSTDFTEYKNQFDIIIGGSPCTYWTIARSPSAKIQREIQCSGLGWELFFQYVKAIKNVKPKYFLYENNYSISKAIKNKITEELEVEPIYINSNLVSAQNRKRLYWTNIPNVIQPEDRGVVLSDILDTDYEYLQQFKVKKTPSRIRMWNEGKGRINGALCCDNITHKEKSGTVTSKQDRNYNAGLIEFEDFCRYLTIHEQERLQTLPTGYTDGVPQGAATLAIGNGWTVDVIAHIFSFLPDEYKIK